MAKAKYVPEVPVTRYVELTLTEKEASVLLGLVGKICGPESGPRGETTSLYYALSSVGVEPTKIRTVSDSSIYIE